MNNLQIALKSFNKIKNANSGLQMSIGEDTNEFIDLEMNIDEQEGLNFPVFLNLQNADELCMIVEPLFGEWFPCSDPVIASKYVESVNGILSGEYRIKVTNRNDRAVKAVLQKPENSSWKTIFTWQTFHLPFGKRTITYIQNELTNIELSSNAGNNCYPD